ncbi:Uncharacterized protein DBV15_03164 [Temnothorax longispinosus]|uniref:Uncharacterized protein n=1 Tax=Temnothorax longispinosus TaxID=300112 RepID=A0A4S2KTA1_9HYME|nr:Uncharacterized protein DBV15_03164 [Temnothorax longispinosus]
MLIFRGINFNPLPLFFSPQGADEDDSASVASQLDGKSREWLVRAAQGDYQALAKLAAEEPRLTRLKAENKCDNLGTSCTNRTYATSGDNDKGSGREVRKYNYGVAYRRPGDQAVITRTAELNTCGVVNSPFSRAAIDRSINLRAPVAIRRPLYTMLAICGADQEWRMVAG